MSDDRLNEGVIALDLAVEHADRGLHGLAEDWSAERRARAGETLEAAIAELQTASKTLTATEPGGLWGTRATPEPDRPYLARAIELAQFARQRIARAIESGQARSELPRDEVERLLGEAAASIDRAVDRLLWVLSGAQT